jgi:hypothetical protein
MKLMITMNVSVDGVMQGLGGPGEDRRGGFERGGWARGVFDDETTTFITQTYQRADATWRWTWSSREPTRWA